MARATSSSRPLRITVAAALVACYGILCLIATAPHAHDRWSQAAAGGGPDATLRPHDPAGPAGGVPGLQTDCPLCAWHRTMLRPPATPAASAPSCAQAHRPAEAWPADSPFRAHWKPLRAPPAA